MVKAAVLCLANCVILVGGLAVLGIGIWIYLDKLDKEWVEPLVGTELYVTTAYILMAAGIFTIIVSFLGCCGAWYSKEWMLKAYFVILLLVFCVMLTGGIIGFVLRHEAKDVIKKSMKDNIENFGWKAVISRAWVQVHTHFNCCGVPPDGKTEGDGYLIWKDHSQLVKKNKTVPDFCCKGYKAFIPEEIAACQEDPKNNTHEKDCYNSLLEFVNQNALLLAVIAIVVALALIMGMMLSCGVLRTIRKEKQKIGL